MLPYIGLSVKGDEVRISPRNDVGSCPKTLLDSYTLDEDDQLIEVCSNVQKHSLTMCTALVSPKDDAVSLLLLQHQPNAMGRKIYAKVAHTNNAD